MKSILLLCQIYIFFFLLNNRIYFSRTGEWVGFNQQLLSGSLNDDNKRKKKQEKKRKEKKRKEKKRKERKRDMEE